MLSLIRVFLISENAMTETFCVYSYHVHVVKSMNCLDAFSYSFLADLFFFLFYTETGR